VIRNTVNIGEDLTIDVKKHIVTNFCPSVPTSIENTCNTEVTTFKTEYFMTDTFGTDLPSFIAYDDTNN